MSESMLAMCGKICCVFGSPPGKSKAEQQRLEKRLDKAISHAIECGYHNFMVGCTGSGIIAAAIIGRYKMGVGLIGDRFPRITLTALVPSKTQNTGQEKEKPLREVLFNSDDIMYYHVEGAPTPTQTMYQYLIEHGGVTIAVWNDKRGDIDDAILNAKKDGKAIYIIPTTSQEETEWFSAATPSRKLILETLHRGGDIDGIPGDPEDLDEDWVELDDDYGLLDMER